HDINQKLIDVFEQHVGQLSDRNIAVFSHLLNAHEIWNFRLLNKESGTATWQRRPVQTLANINKQNFRQTLDILEGGNLEALILFTDKKGNPFENKKSDILFHIINHSSYHRGQIAIECRKSG